MMIRNVYNIRRNVASQYPVPVNPRLSWCTISYWRQWDSLQTRCKL